MRRSLVLVAASCWLLQLGACGEQAPAKAPPLARARQGSRPLPARQKGGSVAGAAPREVADPSERSRVPAAGTGGRGAPPPTSDALAEHYGRSKVLGVQQGSASYYGDSFAGRPTASGVPYQPYFFSAAHRSLPFGTVLRVTRSDAAKSVYVTVTDRGPYGPRGRILDLSRAAAEQLGMLRAGVVKIKLEVLEYGQRKRGHRGH